MTFLILEGVIIALAWGVVSIAVGTTLYKKVDVNRVAVMMRNLSMGSYATATAYLVDWLDERDAGYIPYLKKATTAQKNLQYEIGITK